MVKPTLEEIRASDLTPLERELALASFGAEALADVPAAVTPAAAAARKPAPVKSTPASTRAGSASPLHSAR